LSAVSRKPETSAHLTVRRVRLVAAALAAHLDLLFDEGVSWDDAEGQRFLTDPANLLVVAFWDDIPCGFATAHRLQRFDHRRAEVLLYEIGVDEPYQRRGIGAALVAAVTSWAAEVGADEVWVLAEGEDDRAQAFYRAIGGIADEQGAVMFTFPVAGES
jgi:ribosomal protein S18 acetylase RimI-like enzyme